MDDTPAVGLDEEGRILKEFQAHYGAPAYVRRTQQVQEAFDHLVHRCRRQREEWLGMVRLRLGLLGALAGGWDRLLPWLADGGQVDALRQLHAALTPRLRTAVQPSSSPRILRRALAELKESIDRFNHRWGTFLHELDLTQVNTLRDAYNRYYVLEKECAVRSARLARQGFQRLEPLTVEALALLLPPLPVPRLKE